MKSCHYYSFNDNKILGSINACSLSSEEYPLTLNCAGRTVANFPFATDNIDGREDYYFIYVEHGEMTVWLGGIKHVAPAGSIIIFPPRYHYRYEYSRKEPLSYLWAHFTGSYAKDFIKACGFATPPCLYSSSSGANLSSGFLGLFEIFEAGGALRDRRLSCKLEEIIINAAISITKDHDNRTLERSLRHIHTSYDKEIRIPDLARMESLSNSRYISVFKEKTGLAPSEYIINLRMNVACDLLRNTDMSVKEIAYSVGYSDAHFFGKLFKKKTGVTPQKYARA